MSGFGKLFPAVRSRAQDVQVRRKLKRFRVDANAEVTWQPAGGPTQTASVKCLDMSEADMTIRTAVPLPCPGVVYFSTKSLGLAGAARVRHCKPKGFRYIAGLEFSGSLARVG